jgi:putative RecB family exonuclease
MTWTPPDSISPSRMGAFLQCPLKFRFESIQKLGAASTNIQALTGTTVHHALEMFYELAPEHRTPEQLAGLAADAAQRAEDLDEYRLLVDTDDAKARFGENVVKLSMNALEMEDPTAIVVEGLELRLEVDVEGWLLRGIIDRLRRDGQLVIDDWKSGKAPSEKWEGKSMLGVHLYSVMCEEHFGEIPAEINLLYLASKMTLTARPTERTNKAARQKLRAVRAAIERACERDDFRPSPSNLCNNYCDFQAFCPAFGGDPAQAAELVEAR